MRAVAALVLVAAALAGAATPAAVAAPQLSAGISDDGILLFDPDPARAPAVVAQWKAAGVDTVRIQVRWVTVVRDRLSTAPPLGFDASNPDDPGYDWAVLDRAVALVADAGLEPLLAVTGSGPLWASARPALGNPRVAPDPAKFGAFAGAVARRYGSRVRRYIVWNEPNQPLWLQPQQECLTGPARCSPVAPHLYRALLRAAYPAMKAADPSSEVLGGALAPRGLPATKRNNQLRPLAFLRAFGCVDTRLRPVRTGRCRGFRPARMDGFAYHPHPVKASPSTPARNRDDAAIADLGRLITTLDGVQRARGFTTPTGAHAAIHLTEFSYQTNPPDRADGIPVALASRYLQEAIYLAWRHPRVKTLVQYAWQDDPVRNLGPGRRRYAGWQSGLIDVRGRAKRTLSAFEHPFVADRVVAAPRVRFWGQVRAGRSHTIRLLKRGVSGIFTPVRTLRTDARGTFSVTLPVREPSAFRYVTADGPGSARITSDTLIVTPPRRPSSSSAHASRDD